MSFPKAAIRRFNEGTGCTPPPGSYDPKFDTDVSVTSSRKDNSLYRTKRFTPTPTKTASANGKGHLKPLIPFPLPPFPRSNSTSSLHSTQVSGTSPGTIDSSAMLNETMESKAIDLDMTLAAVDTKKQTSELLENQEFIKSLQEQLSQKIKAASICENEELKLCIREKDSEIQRIQTLCQEDREVFKSMTQEYQKNSEMMTMKLKEAFEIKRELISIKEENEAKQQFMNQQEEKMENMFVYSTTLEQEIEKLKSELETQVGLSDGLHFQLGMKTREAELSEEEVKELKLKCYNLENSNKNYAAGLQNAEALIEPFKQQLEAYKAEMVLVENGKMANESQCRQIFSKYADLLGHQNKKQKIHHIVKLKEDNLKGQKEIQSLRKQLARAKETLAQIERERFRAQPRRFDPKAAFNPADNTEKQNTPIPM